MNDSNFAYPGDANVRVDMFLSWTGRLEVNIDTTLVGHCMAIVIE